MSSRLPERVVAHGLVLRRWRVDDAPALGRAVSESADHLRPWMGWVAQEPLSAAERRAMIKQWEQDWERGGDVLLGILRDRQIVGGCGLHRRLGPGGLEIGYWIHPSFVRRGFATVAASALTSAALALPDISYVEIHHDKANLASEGVPRKLGFRVVAEEPDQPEAPAECGTELRWRMGSGEWHAD